MYSIATMGSLIKSPFCTKLLSFETMIKLISATKTKKGLTVASRLDEKEYTKGVKILNEEMEKIRNGTIPFHQRKLIQISYLTVTPKLHYMIGITLEKEKKL